MSEAPKMLRTDKTMPAERLHQMLAEAYAGRLATTGPDGWPYVVPLLYVWADDEIWVHNTAARGHLRGNVEHEARACFEIDEPGEVFAYGRFECDTSVAYRSVVLFGRLRIVDDSAQKALFFDRLMGKYADSTWARPSGFYPRLDQVTVYAMTVERMTGKEQLLPTAQNRWPAADHSRSPTAVPPPPDSTRRSTVEDGRR
jgi:uncharacterized protein